MTPHDVFVFSHTHWDREWYLPFEGYRFKLVERVDELLELMEGDPAYKHFTLDGQTIVLEDYSQIRPRNRSRLEALVQAGRLEVGPWYVLPDVYLESGESVVRNLTIGHRIGEAFGKVMPVAYLPDPFGYPNALPVILRGFGINALIFGRGMSEALETIGCEFQWAGESGETCWTYWLPTGYGDGVNFGYYQNWGDTRHGTPKPEYAVERVQKNIDRTLPLSRSGKVVISNGIDHCDVEPTLPKAIAWANERMPHAHVVHASLEQFVRAARDSGATFDTFHGELNSTYNGMTLQSVYSARMYLKQQNNAAQLALEKYAEPLSAMNAFAGDGRSSRDILWYAWKRLVQNHPHDSICGCSVDSVHREMEVRFEKVRQIEREVVYDSLVRLGGQIKFSRGGIPILMANPHGFGYRGPVTLGVPLRRWDQKEAFRDFTLHDSAGRELPYVRRGEAWVREMHTCSSEDRHVVTVTTDVEIPPCGYAIVYAEPGKPKARKQSRLKTTANSIESPLYRLTFQANGSCNLLVKESGTLYEGLHVFEDAEDAGDEYDYSPCAHGKTITSAGSRAEVTITADPFVATAVVTLTMRLPVGLAPDRKSRSRETVAQTLRTEIRVHADLPRIDFVTRATNQAKDHRLRVLFPTGMTPPTHHVEQHFSIIERTSRQPWNERYFQKPYPTRNQKSFASVSQGGEGFTLINRGLPEYELTEQGTFALTLVRSVGWLSRGDMLTRPGHAGPGLETPEAQCQREFDWEYAILPHRGDCIKARAWEQAHSFNAPPHSRLGNGLRGDDPRCYDGQDFRDNFGFVEPKSTGRLADRYSLVTIEGKGVILSAVKEAHDFNALVIRVYSVRRGPRQKVRVKAGFELGGVMTADLNERPSDPVTLSGRRAFAFEMGYGEIRTFLLRPREVTAFSNL
jgi:mannosylglycerate hydrolase